MISPRTPSTIASRSPRLWWRDSVVYQLYVKSFADSDGDGVGDLDGITRRLDHIAALGVDGIWLNPCYPSPNRDGGYDVADYTVIDPRYGGMPAFGRLLDATHAHGLKLLMDLVPNHCSDQHEWFQQARVAGPGSLERDRFLFRAGRGDGGRQPPNNWQSTFGGPAWTRINDDPADGEWYLHSFDSSQPDFNWDNVDVVTMFDDVLTTWFDRGIDGFRIDVAYAMVKRAGLPDVDDPAGDNPYLWNQPGVHEIFKRWRAIADSYDRELTLLGEVWLPPLDAADYIRSGELTQVFYFDLLQQPFEAASFRRSIQDTVTGLGQVDGVPTWTLNSHDVHRAVTRYGLVEPVAIQSADLNALRTRARGLVDIGLGTRRAQAATLLMLALPGSVYLFQGEELGLPEVQDLPDGARQDPIWERSGHTEYGRDGCRVPLPWTIDAAEGFGFLPAADAAAPWLPQPSWYSRFAAEIQTGDPTSVLSFYRAALRARRHIDQTTSLEWIDTGREDVVAFRRGSLVSATVFAGTAYLAPQSWGEQVCRSDFATGPLTAGTTGWWIA